MLLIVDEHPTHYTGAVWHCPSSFFSRSRHPVECGPGRVLCLEPSARAAGSIVHLEVHVFSNDANHDRHPMKRFDKHLMWWINVGVGFLVSITKERRL